MQGVLTIADVDAELAPAADTTETDAQHAVAAGTSNDPFEVWPLPQEWHPVVALDLADHMCSRCSVYAQEVACVHLPASCIAACPCPDHRCFSA